jgi:hypothetical protein
MGIVTLIMAIVGLILLIINKKFLGILLIALSAIGVYFPNPSDYLPVVTVVAVPVLAFKGHVGLAVVFFLLTFLELAIIYV